MTTQLKDTVYQPILRWMGGKSKLAKPIIDTFPKHTCYVEVFCGGAAILLKKPRSKCEHLDWADCITRYDSHETLVYCDTKLKSILN